MIETVVCRKGHSRRCAGLRFFMQRVSGPPPWRCPFCGEQALDIPTEVEVEKRLDRLSEYYEARNRVRVESQKKNGRL